MEGLEASVLTFGEALAENGTKRIDPEFFNKAAVAAFRLLKDEPRLGQFVKDGYRVVYENTKIVDRDEGISENLPFFLQSADIATPFINQERMSCVPESEWIRYPKGRISPGELLIEVKGKAEKVAVVPNDFPERTLVTGTCFKLTTCEEWQRSLLLAHLTGKYGKILKDRLKTNLLVSYIAKGDLYRIPVPTLGHSLARKIHSFVQRSLATRNEVLQARERAEAVLLAAFGLADWTPPEPLSYSARARDILSVGRLDAEHFRPKYAAAKAHIAASGATTEPLLNLIEPLRNGVDLREFIEGGTPYIRVGDIKDGRIEFDHAATVAHSAASVKQSIHLMEGDVLFTRKGSFGNAAVVGKNQTEAILSTEIMLLRLNERGKSALISDYLAAFFNSQLGKLQAEQWAHGVAFYSVTQDDLYKFEIPLPDRATQQSISAQLHEAERLRFRSSETLEAAKRAVEIAIEDGEDAAMAFLDEAEGAE